MESYTPHVIEPSFGIDRVFTAVLEHSYYSRPQDPEDKEKINRGVLALTPDVAPYKVIVMPLDQKVGSHAKYLTILEEMRAALSDNAINYKVDDSGASVGKRYARNDELGVPLAITIDYQSIGQSEAGENVELEGTGTQFTCFTGTKVQILTQKAQEEPYGAYAAEKENVWTWGGEEAEWVRQWRGQVLSLLALLVQKYKS